jgi:hypothetical protein
MDHEELDGRSRISLPAAIVALIVLYSVTLVAGWPQSATQQIVAGNREHGGAHQAIEGGAATDRAEAKGEQPGSAPLTPHNAPIPPAASPPYWMVAPFAVLLLGIAVLPLIPATAHWWESNLHRFYVSVGLSLVVLAYYVVVHKAPIEGHWPAHHVVAPTDGSVQVEFVKTVLANAILQEFIPFIVLLFSLYTISGGIRITGDLQAHPMTNASFLAVGALLASFIGTTGAAMLLIRPVLETNRERKHVAHTIVMFIFIVCNCGGCLLPLGDPPLFGRAVLVDACAVERVAVRQWRVDHYLFIARHALVLPT